jgi:two-component system response regulator HydG
MPDKSAARVLVVDDSIEMARVLAEGLADRGYDGVPCGSGGEAAQRLTGETFDAVVTDLRMPRVDGLELLAISRRLAPQRPVIIITAYSAIDTAVECIRQGAYHYLTKPVKLDELNIFLSRALEEARVRREATSLRATLRERFSTSAIVGTSQPIRALHDFIERVADTPAPVLIFGETGSGKGLVARALHAESQRASAPFVAVNCAALPENLLESELFGHVRGAFTGATADRVGLFAQADGGTLFLDEIGDMPASLQAKLLHVLEQNVIRPIGSERERRIDVRIIAATHRDLPVAVRQGQFREDLLYRLDVVSVRVPALRNRREDLPDLAARFLEQARARYPRSPVERFGAEALELLGGYGWPGNVRELAHTIEKAVLLGNGPEIVAKDLPEVVRQGQSSDGMVFQGEVIPIRKLQRKYAAWALARFGGHRGRTTESLGIDAKTLNKWLNAVDDDGGDK